MATTTETMAQRFDRIWAEQDADAAIEQVYERYGVADATDYGQELFVFEDGSVFVTADYATYSSLAAFLEA